MPPAYRPRRLFVLLALLVGPGLAGAAETSPILSLPAVIADARERNPALAAARERARAMTAVPAQARAWDDPTLSYEAWNTPNSFRIDQADNNIFRVAQRVPFPGKRALAGEVATHAADEATRDAEGSELEIIASVKRAYYDFWQASERVAILTRDKTLVERIASTVAGRYGTSDASQTDVLRAQVEVSHLASTLATERLAIERARVALAALTSRESAAIVGRPVLAGLPSLTVDTNELLARARAQRPDIAARASAVAREESAVQLARRERYPDFELAFSRFVNFEARDGFGAMVSMTLPVLNGAKYGAAVDEATARASAAHAEQRRADDALRREVEETVLRVRTALVRHELFAATHVPQAEQILRLSDAGYQSGSVSFLELLDTVRSIQSTHLEHVEARAELEKGYADLERVVGTELPRSAGMRGSHD